MNSVHLELVRTVSFSSAHRYASATLSREENQRIYGSLYRDEGFGHNFLVEAHLTGPVDPLTGMIANLTDIDAWLKSAVARFDHTYLNDLPEFSGSVPTLERIAKSVFDGVELKLRSVATLVKIRLYEGEATWIDYFG